MMETGLMKDVRAALRPEGGVTARPTLSALITVTLIAASLSPGAILAMEIVDVG